MSDKLKQMLDDVRGYQMSPEEMRAQEIDFVFGNVHFENSRITREMVAIALPMSIRDRSK